VFTAVLVWNLCPDGNMHGIYIDTLGGLDLDGSTDKNLLFFVVENLANLAVHAMRPKNQQSGSLINSR